jgi:hypothetical protein
MLALRWAAWPAFNRVCRRRSRFALKISGNKLTVSACRLMNDPAAGA